jgi:hypothetical protein
MVRFLKTRTSLFLWRGGSCRIINTQKYRLHIDIPEVFGFSFFRTSIRAIDTTEIRKAVMNIILYDSKEGNDRVKPFIET